MLAAKIDARDDTGNTALQTAEMASDTEVAKLLRDKSKVIPSKENDMKKVLFSIFAIVMVLSWSHPAAGQTGSNSLNDRLIAAADKGDAATVRQLLDNGANIDAKNDDGETALIGAAYGGETEAVVLLLAKGANIEVRNNDGKTALKMAELAGRDEVVQLLKTKGAH